MTTKWHQRCCQCLNIGVSGRQLRAHAMCGAQVASAHVNVHAVLCMCIEYRRGVHISLGWDMLAIASYRYMLVAI